MEVEPIRIGDNLNIVETLASILQELCNRNDKEPNIPRAGNKFHSLKPPIISIKDYLARIDKYASCSKECFILALIYIDRVIQVNNSPFTVNSYTVHRVIITAVMLAAKFFDDQYYNNAYFAKVGGVTCPEINSLEVEFLFMNNFTLYVATDVYNNYVQQLATHASRLHLISVEKQNDSSLGQPNQSSSSQRHHYPIPNNSNPNFPQGSTVYNLPQHHDNSTSEEQPRSGGSGNSDRQPSIASGVTASSGNQQSSAHNPQDKYTGNENQQSASVNTTESAQMMKNLTINSNQDHASTTTTPPPTTTASNASTSSIQSHTSGNNQGTRNDGTVVATSSGAGSHSQGHHHDTRSNSSGSSRGFQDDHYRHQHPQQQHHHHQQQQQQQPQAYHFDPSQQSAIPRGYQ